MPAAELGGQAPMSEVRVEKIIVKDFKRIGGIEIDLKPITALVGGNTSGKSSVLQAAQLCVSLMQASYRKTRRNGEIESLTTLANEAVSYRPTDYLLDLKHGGAATQTSGFEIGFECSDRDADGAEVRRALKVGVLRGKNANLALDLDGDRALIPVFGNRDRPFSIFAPGLSGIPLREEWRTRGALDAAAMHGDANLYLRTLLDHLLHKDMTEEQVQGWCDWKLEIDALPATAPWRTFSTLLDRCYPGARVYVKHDREKDRHISVSVWYQEQSAALDMASTGMLQVIQILAYACFYSPPLLLLDEPDAHLHADSQARVYEALRGLAATGNTRIVFATHSPQLIQLMLGDSEAAVVWMEGGNKVEVGPAGRPAIPLLMELGALTLGAEVFSPGTRTVLLTEDKEAGPVQLFARANGARDFACLSYNGCGNLAGARELARLLTELRADIRVVIHRDRDFRTPEEVAFERFVFEAWLANNRVERVEELFTPLNDVEHSFLQPAHLAAALADRGVDRARAEAILADAVAVARDQIIVAISKARRKIEETLYESRRMKKKTDLRARAGIGENAPRENGFLPADGRTPLRLDQCHGKTAYRAFLNALHGVLAGDSRTMPSLVLKESEHLRTDVWVTAFMPPEEPAVAAQ